MHNRQNVDQIKYSSVDKRIRKMRYTLKMEYCSAIKKKKAILPFATYMKLEDMMLSEINKTELQTTNLNSSKNKFSSEKGV